MLKKYNITKTNFVEAMVILAQTFGRFLKISGIMFYAMCV